MLRASLLSFLLLAAAPAAALAGINEVLECSATHDQTFREAPSLELVQAYPMFRVYAPAQGRAFGYAPTSVRTASDGEEDVVFVAIAAPYQAVLAAVLAERGLTVCPESFGVPNYCHLMDRADAGSMVVQADPEAADATLISCSFSLNRSR